MAGMSPDRPEREPDKGRVQERARERQHERASIVEDIVDQVDGLLGDTKYPITSEELAVEYADTEIELANETESLGSVFDRLVDERFESPDEAREAVLNELTGEADGPAEYNDERALSQLDDEESNAGPE